MNWDDPASRLELIQLVGTTEYNRRLAEHQRESTLNVVNGYRIRLVRTKFGYLFQVDTTTEVKAFVFRESAEAHANGLPRGSAK